MEILQCNAMADLIDNMQDVDRLLEIHGDVSGSGRGRRYGVEVLHRSGVVLITACWEAFVEDLAVEAFDFLLSKADAPDRIPAKVRAMASKPLKEADNQARVWDLAGEGWRQVLQKHKRGILDAHVGKLNTPRPSQVDAIYLALLGVRALSSSWCWPRVSSETAQRKLNDYITDRGSIVHRTRTKSAVGKRYVKEYRGFVYRLAVKSVNSVHEHVGKTIGIPPWAGPWQFGKMT